MKDNSTQREGTSMPRRDVLKGIGAAGAAAAAGPIILGATDKAESKAVVLGEGTHKYELVPDWGKLPDNHGYGYTHGVCVDSQKRVFIHNMGDDCVAIFDPAGKFIKSWGKDFKGGAHGMQLRKEGSEEFLYLATTGLHTVVKTTLDGKVVWTLNFPKECEAYGGKPDKYVPTNIAFGPNGDFYVADGYGLSWIHQYNQKAEYIRSWGGAGKEPGKMSCPHGIWCDTRGPEPELVVADRSNVRLQYFTMDGKHKRFVTEELRHPCHFDQRGEDLLIPDLHGRVTIFDKNNKLVVHLGDNAGVEKVKGYPNLPQDQRIPGKFISPHGACWDSEGNIYVVEWVSDGRITKLRHVA